GRLVGGGDDHDRARQTLRSEVALDEFLHLAATLADEGDHAHVAVGVAADHAQQRALADAGPGEDAQALPATAGDQGIDCADAGRERVLDWHAAQRIGRAAAEAGLVAAQEWPLPVDRSPEPVDDPAEQFRSDLHAVRRAARNYPAAGAHAP